VPFARPSAPGLGTGSGGGGRLPGAPRHSADGEPVTRSRPDPSRRCQFHGAIERVTESILRGLQGPSDLRGLSEAQLTQLAAEIRETIVTTVARTGGHLGSS